MDIAAAAAAEEEEVEIIAQADTVDFTQSHRRSSLPLSCQGSSRLIDVGTIPPHHDLGRERQTIEQDYRFRAMVDTRRMRIGGVAGGEIVRRLGSVPAVMRGERRRLKVWTYAPSLALWG